MLIACVKATWAYDAETKTLAVAGTGAMSDYEGMLNGEERPWDGLDIDAVVIEEGITYIGAYAFKGFSSITSARGLANDPARPRAFAMVSHMVAGSRS